VLEGVAFNLRWVQDRVARFAKRDISRVKLYGGGGLSSAWAQIFADILQRPVEQLSEPEYTVSRGVAMLGFHQLGGPNLDETAVPIAAVYEPRKDLSVRYERMFKQFVRAFKRNRGVFRALNAGSEP
jgi:sugar (pentulose or hexulose) kinase